MGTFNVSLKTLTERVSLEVVYTPKELDQINVEIAEVNRPGLFLAGYYDYFDKLRLQIMGLAEMNFLSGLSAEKRYEALEQLFRQQPPAVIVGRSEELEPQPDQRAEPGAGSPHHPARRAGGGVRRGHPDPGRQRHRQERAGH